MFATSDGSQPSKTGWASTFEHIATSLGLAITLRRRHPCSRATQLVLRGQFIWRKARQSFGEFSSSAVGEATALSNTRGELAKESTLSASLAAAKAELSSLLHKAREHIQPLPSKPLPRQPVEDLVDCEASAGLMDPPLPTMATDMPFVLNRTRNGKVHKVAVATRSPSLSHRLWRARCHWYFARCQADYQLAEQFPEGSAECAKCFNHPRRQRHEESSSSSSSSEPTCASQVG